MEPMYWLLALLGVMQLVSLILSVKNQNARLEWKIDLILRHLGIQPKPGGRGELSDRVKELASDPAQKIQAISVHRQETGAGLKEAKEAVEKWIASQGK